MALPRGYSANRGYTDVFRGSVNRNADDAGADRHGFPTPPGSDRDLLEQLADLPFTEAAQNVAFVIGMGTGERQNATTLAVSSINARGKRVRCYSVVDPVNAREQKTQQANPDKCPKPVAYGSGHSR